MTVPVFNASQQAFPVTRGVRADHDSFLFTVFPISFRQGLVFDARLHDEGRDIVISPQAFESLYNALAGSF